MRGTHQQIQLGTSTAELWTDIPLIFHSEDYAVGLPYGLTYRDDQEQIAVLIEALLASHRSVFVDAPTGIGKSILAISAAAGTYTDDETLPPLILTSNHGLQQQYTSFGISSITGRKNWPCLLDTTRTAENAICTTAGAPADCVHYRVCPYFVQKRAGLESDIVVTNYHYALKAWGFSPSTPLLIGDEAHSAEDILRENATLKVYLPGAVKKELIDHTSAIRLAEDLLNKMNFRFDASEEPDEENAPLQSPREKARRKSATLRRMIASNPDDYVCAVGFDTLQFVPLRGFWPRVPSSLYLSATLFDPYVTEPPGPVAYLRLPSPFPVENRRVYMGNRISLTHRSAPYEYEMMAQEIDHIIARNPGRGVIHTPSYSLAERLYGLSSYQDEMLMHRGGERDAAVRQFKDGYRRILLSPAVSEGVDFPGGECEWQVIAKLPFPDNRDPVVKEIANRTKGLTETQVARTIVQQAGRGVRSKTDVCPTYILDAGFAKWFYPRNRELFPRWFTEALSAYIG